MPRLQLGVTFSDEESDLYEKLRALNDESGIPISSLVKRSLRAVFDEDDEELRKLRAYAGFSEARLPQGRAAKATG